MSQNIAESSTSTFVKHNSNKSDFPHYAAQTLSSAIHLSKLLLSKPLNGLYNWMMESYI